MAKQKIFHIGPLYGALAYSDEKPRHWYFNVPDGKHVVRIGIVQCLGEEATLMFVLGPIAIVFAWLK